MRWTRLFDDLEAQLVAAERAELEGEIAEHTRTERAAVGLADRLSADLGRPLRVTVLGVGAVAGTLVELGDSWLAVRAEAVATAPDVALVPFTAVVAVQGLTGSAAVAPRPGPRPWGLRSALRAISRDRTMVRLTDIGGGRHTGRLDRVGRDHLDLRVLADDGVGAAPAPGPWGDVLTVPYATLAAVVGPGAGRD